MKMNRLKREEAGPNFHFLRCTLSANRKPSNSITLHMMGKVLEKKPQLKLSGIETKMEEAQNYR